MLSNRGVGIFSVPRERGQEGREGVSEWRSDGGGQREQQQRHMGGWVDGE